jgi:alanine-synthesizing transaminase
MPFYPGNLDGVLAAGCEPYHIAMTSVGHFVKNLEAALVGGLNPVAVVLSFDNPRWLRRTYDDYRYLLFLAKKYNFVLISDEAYRDLAYDGNVCSVMQVRGWQQFAVCIQTASKPFCMAGWKLGAIVASLELLPKILEVKGRDSEGGSPAAQKGYAAALWCVWYPQLLALKYHKRAIYTVSKLRAIGIIDIDRPLGGMFVYFGLRGMSSLEFVEKLKALGFEVTPGDRFGEPDMIRWCLNQPNWVTRLAVRAVAQVLQQRAEKAA